MLISQIIDDELNYAEQTHIKTFNNNNNNVL